MHGDYFAKDQPAGHHVSVGPLQLNDLGDLALERHRTFRHPWHLNDFRGGRCQSGQLEFIDLRRDHGAALVHLLGQWSGRQVPGEFAGLFDIVQAVFAPDTGKTNDWRNVIEGVEEAVGGQVQAAIGIL
ncbi:hypothetical protein D3C87_1794690 [compost metagenome]